MRSGRGQTRSLSKLPKRTLRAGFLKSQRMRGSHFSIRSSTPSNSTRKAGQTSFQALQVIYPVQSKSQELLRAGITSYSSHQNQARNLPFRDPDPTVPFG